MDEGGNEERGARDVREDGGTEMRGQEKGTRDLIKDQGKQ